MSAVENWMVLLFLQHQQVAQKKAEPKQKPMRLQYIKAPYAELVFSYRSPFLKYSKVETTISIIKKKRRFYKRFPKSLLALNPAYQFPTK